MVTEWPSGAAEVKFTPAGNAPAAIDHEKGEMPEEIVQVVEYACPTCTGPLAGVQLKASGALMVPEIFCEAVCAVGVVLSVTRTTYEYGPGVVGVPPIVMLDPVAALSE